MNQGAALGDDMKQVASMMVQRLTLYPPSVVGAVLLLLAGWVLAKVFRAATGRVVAMLDSVIGRVFGASLAERLQLARSAHLLGTLVFWAVMLQQSPAG